MGLSEKVVFKQRPEGGEGQARGGASRPREPGAVGTGSKQKRRPVRPGQEWARNGKKVRTGDKRRWKMPEY